MFTTVVKKRQHNMPFLFNFTFISKNRVETSPPAPSFSPIIRQAAVARTRKAYPQSGRSKLAGREVFLKLNAHWRSFTYIASNPPQFVNGVRGFWGPTPQIWGTQIPMYPQANPP